MAAEVCCGGLASGSRWLLKGPRVHAALLTAAFVKRVKCEVALCVQRHFSKTCPRHGVEKISPRNSELNSVCSFFKRQSPVST